MRAVQTFKDELEILYLLRNENARSRDILAGRLGSACATLGSGISILIYLTGRVYSCISDGAVP